MADLARLVVKLEAEASRFHKETEMAHKRIKRLERSARKMKKALASAFGAVAGITSIRAAIAAMDNFAEGVYRASGNLDNLGKAARRLGLTTDQLQRIRIQAEAAGIQTSVLDTAFQRFARRIGSGSLDKTFKELNISIRDAHGNLKSNFQLWNEFGKKLSSLGDKNRQLALAMNAVDTEGVKLVELWRSSQSSIDAVNKKIRDYGLLFDKSMIDKAEAYQTEVGLIRRAHEAVETKISMGLSRMAADWETLKLKISEAKYAVLDYFGAFGVHADSPEVRGQKLLDELKILNAQRAKLEAAYRNARSKAERADLEERLRINRTYLERNLQERKKILKVLEGKDGALEPKVSMGNVTGSAEQAAEKLRDDLDIMLDGVIAEFDDMNRQIALKQVGLIDQVTVGIRKATDLTSEYMREAMDPDGYAMLDAVSRQFDDLNRQWTQKQVGMIDQIVVGTSKLEEQARKTGDTWTELGGVMSSAFERAILEGDKLSNVLKALEQDILRVIVRTTITDPLSQAISGLGKGSGDWLGGLFGGIAKGIGSLFGSLFGGFMASGGAVNAGSLYVVGEQGPELFIPGQSGTIIPNHALAGGGGDVIVNVIESPGNGGRVNQRDDGGNRVIEIMVEQVKGAVAQDITGGGGSVSAALERTYGLNRAAGSY